MENAFYSIEIAQQLGTNDVQEDVVGYELKDTSALLVLCDGMGGMQRGDLAAKTAVNAIKQLSKQMDWEHNPQEFLRRAIRVADEEVYLLTDEKGERVRGGCTLLVTIAAGRNLYFANVGDSRTYMYKNTELNQMTRDHNYGEVLKRRFRQGKISEQELMAEWSRAAALTSYIGVGEIREEYISSQAFQMDRDSIVLMQSDGLYKLVSEEEMKSILEGSTRNLERAMTRLLEQAYRNKKNYQDNTSVILLRLK